MFIISGGGKSHKKEESLNSTEYFSLTGNYWRAGPTLPEHTTQAVGLPMKGNMFIFLATGIDIVMQRMDTARLRIVFEHFARDVYTLFGASSDHETFIRSKIFLRESQQGEISAFKVPDSWCAE